MNLQAIAPSQTLAPTEKKVPSFTAEQMSSHAFLRHYLQVISRVLDALDNMQRESMNSQVERIRELNQSVSSKTRWQGMLSLGTVGLGLAGIAKFGSNIATIIPYAEKPFNSFIEASKSSDQSKMALEKDHFLQRTKDMRSRNDNFREQSQNHLSKIQDLEAKAYQKT